MDGKKIKVEAIINPISGVGSKRKIPKMIERMCEKGGCPLEISFTEYPGHASELTRKAIDEGANCIIAAKLTTVFSFAPAGWGSMRQ